MKIGITAPITTSLFLTEMELPKENMPQGLISANISNLINGLWLLGHELVIYTLDKTVDENIVFSGNRITVCYGKYRKRFRIFDFFMKERSSLKKLMIKHPVDILHAHWSYEFALAALAVDKNCLITLHDWAPTVFKLMPNYYRFGRLLMHYAVVLKAKYLLANSEYMKQNMQKFRSKLLGEIPNPLDVPFDVITEKRRFSLIAVNNGFNELKNVQNLLYAFSNVQRKLSMCTLSLYGADYESNGKAQQWAKEHKIDCTNIFFVGAVPYEEVLDKIAASELLVHPSREESFGNVLVEAMMRKTVVIGGKDSGAVPYVLNQGQAGIIININSPKEIEKAIIKILKSPDKLHTLQQNAYDFAVRTYSPDIVANMHIDLYKQIIKENK